jgi:hypothetical protein
VKIVALPSKVVLFFALKPEARPTAGDLARLFGCCEPDKASESLTRAVNVGMLVRDPPAPGSKRGAEARRYGPGPRLNELVATINGWAE